MVKLADRQVASLLEEMSASMRAGMPLTDSMRRLQDTRLGNIARAAGQIADRMDQGVSVADSLSSALSGKYPAVASTVATAVRNSDPGLMTRMARLLDRRSDLKRDTHFAWSYPVTLLVVGYVIGVGVMSPIVMIGQSSGIDWPRPVPDLAQWAVGNGSFANSASVLLGIILLAIIGWIAIARRQSFSSATRRALFCQSLADQVTHDVPESEAIHAAAEIAGEEQLAIIGEPSLSNPAVVEIVAAYPDGLPSDLPMDDKRMLIAKLHYLAAIYQEQARRRSILWSRLVPRVAMVVIGGGMILGYAYWVIAPVYQGLVAW